MTKSLPTNASLPVCLVNCKHGNVAAYQTVLVNVQFAHDSTNTAINVQRLNNQSNISGQHKHLRVSLFNAPSIRRPVVDKKKMRPGHRIWLVLRVPLSAWTMMVWWQEGHPARAKPNSTNPQKFSSGTGGAEGPEGETADPGSQAPFSACSRLMICYHIFIP